MQVMNSSSPSFLQAEIADVGQEIYSGPCVSLVAPAAFGEVCILPRHTPFLSKLKPGEIRIETAENERLIYYVSGGYLEVKNSTVTVLADQMLRSTEIDRNAAEAAKAKAEQLLKTSPIDSVRDVAKLELVKALAQLRVLEHIEMTKLNGKRR